MGCLGEPSAKQVQHHGFAVLGPPQMTEPELRCPFQGEGVAVVQHPIPVHTPVELGGIVADLRVVEVLAAGQ